MTIKEALIFKLDDSIEAIDPATVDSTLAFYGLDPDATWVRSKDNPDNCLFYEILIQKKLEANGIKAMSEGGFSVTYASDRKVQEIINLAHESGCLSLIEKYGNLGKPTIKDISYFL